MSPVVIGLLIRALLLLAVAWLAVTVLRRRSASLRALVWTAALAGILVLPAMASVAPTLDVPVWRAEAPAPFAPAPMATSSGDVAVPDGPTVSHEPVGSSFAAAGAPQVPTIDAPATAGSREFLSWSQVALLAWGLVSLILAARIGVSHVSLSRLAHADDAAADERDAMWAPLVNETRARLGIRRSVQVRTTDAIGVPAMAGLFKPVLLLPAEADDWQDEVKRAVVLHELAHVARWDAVGQLVSQLACAVYWFVPLAWHAARRAAILREQASDDVVLMSGIRASSYAANLLNVAQLTGNAALEPATLAMAHPRRIRERIIAILDPGSARAAVRTRSLAAVTITAATVVVLVAAVQPTTQAAPLFLPSGPNLNIIDVAGGPDAEPDTRAVGAQRVAVAPQPESPAAESMDPAPVAQATARRPCERDLDRSSSSTRDDGNNKWWTVTLSSPDCKVELRVDGTVEFNDAFTDVKSLTRGGTFKLDVTEGGVRRELDLRERSGSLVRVYRLDGREQAFDADAQAWLAGILITLDRRTGMGADYRLPHLLKQGGVSGVLRETAQMPSDYARNRYYEKLMAVQQLSDDERAQVLKQVAAMTKSDHYASTILAEVGKRGFQNSDVRAAALSILDRMESDHYRSVSVANVIGSGRPTAADMDVLVRTVERIKSDHYKLEVLNRLVSGPLQAEHRTALARAARTVESDHYAAEFLKALMKGGADGPERQVFFDVIDTIESDHYVVEVLRSLVARQPPSRTEFQHGVRTLAKIESDHYQNEAVQALLTARDLTESDLIALVDAISPMSGDHYKSESLQAVVRHRAASDRVRSAVVAASDRLSSHYREQVRRAAGR